MWRRDDRHKATRKRKKSRKSNLAKAREHNVKNKVAAAEKSTDGVDRDESSAKFPLKKRRKRTQNFQKTRFTKRACATRIKDNAYRVVGVPRGKIDPRLRSVRNLRSAREKNRQNNEARKQQSRKRTRVNQAARRDVARIAYDNLVEVCILFVCVFIFIFMCLFTFAFVFVV